HVLHDGQVVGRAWGAHQREDLVLFDQLLGHAGRARRIVAVVVGDPGDLPAVDAALLVEHLEVAFVGVVLDLGGGLRTGEDLPGAELDLRVGDAHLVLFGRPADLLGDGRGGLVQVGGRGSGSGAAG